jgi:hypothetical protein
MHRFLRVQISQQWKVVKWFYNFFDHRYLIDVFFQKYCHLKLFNCFNRKFTLR